MSCVQKARRCLKGYWAAAVTVEFVSMAFGLLVPLASLIVLRIFGLSAEKVVRASDLVNGGWIYAVIIAALLIIDWLLISPVILGRQSFYWGIVSGADVSVFSIFRYYGRHYVFSLRWRLSRWLYRVAYTGICLLPAAFAVGTTRAIRQSGINTAFADVLMLFGTVFGFVFFIFGLIFTEILMIRTMPAAFLLTAEENDKYPKQLFRCSVRLMRGHVAREFNLLAGFAGWFVCCALFFPYFYVMPLYSAVRTISIGSIIERGLKDSKFGNRHPDKAALDDTIQIPAFTTERE
ncbi:MAG: hypothetical protein PHX02_05925 [Oscillospiraceae bacterium]|nr:hypothetical protein [Oscillospiraceae bacterium]